MRLIVAHQRELPGGARQRIFPLNSPLSRLGEKKSSSTRDLPLQRKDIRIVKPVPYR